MRNVEGKVAVVTGGANGIGLAMGRHFAEHGMKVMLADIQPEPARRRRSAGCGPTGSTSPGASPTSRSRSRSSTSPTQTVGEFGGVHVLCNNAGIGPGGQTQLWEYEPNDWRWCVDVNVLGIAWGIKAFVPRDARAGHRGSHRQHVVRATAASRRWVTRRSTR